MHDLNIKYKNGEMIIHMDEFFPCKRQRDLKVILDCIDYSLIQDDKEKCKHVLKEHFIYRLNTLNEIQKQSKKDFNEYYQKRCDAEHRLEDGKYSNGVIIPSIQLKEIKKDFRRYKKIENSAVKNFKKCDSQKKKFNRYLEIIGE